MPHEIINNYSKKIKFEWTKTFINANSVLVASLAGMTTNNESIDTFSFPHNVAF